MSDLNQLIGKILDPYARQARLAPALIVLLPAIALVMVWFPASWTGWGVIVSVAFSCGLVLLLAQIARDRGKKREAWLYKQWDGKPSVALLRHRDHRIGEHTKARYRAFLRSRLSELDLPSPEEEAAYNAKADAAYESATAWLLTQTRDTKRFSLLFGENISYGFRRNLWGLKPIGIAISFASAATSTGVVWYQFSTASKTPSIEIAAVTVSVWLLVLIWTTIVTPSWVRIPADAYGAQLLAACDTLNSKE